VWWAALIVTLCGIAATAHGLYAVVHACGVMSVIAGLYVPITDGLALVAYAATDRLSGAARGYAWAVVIVAAGLSGLAQAVNLAGLGDPDERLKFGVGYWPAVAVAVAAHLLWLVGHAQGRGLTGGSPDADPAGSMSTGSPDPVGLGEPGFTGLTEPAPEPCPEPVLSGVHEPEPGGLISPPEPEPARRPRARRARAQVPAAAPQVECRCGLDKCPGRVSKSTRTRHRAEVAEALEAALRVGQNGHHDPAGNALR
jgi:hypothetical protein